MYVERSGIRGGCHRIPDNAGTLCHSPSQEMLTRHTVDVIGEVFTDVLELGADRVVRLGGVCHAARALAAIGTDAHLHVWRPSYMAEQLISACATWGESLHVLGTIVGSPNVILVNRPSEAGPQGYDEILREQWQEADPGEYHPSESVTDVLVFPGRYRLESILRTVPLDAKVHVDLHYNVSNPNVFGILGNRFETAILSTSSPLFRDRWNSDTSQAVQELISIGAQKVLIKENRGGSRCFVRDGGVVSIPAFLGSAVHSVGVGDCFDAVYVGLACENLEVSLRYASLVSSAYASSIEDREFGTQAKWLLETSPKDLVDLDGINLPWECRPHLIIYLAFPDFPGVDHRQFNLVRDALRYHNFTNLIQPVVDHGLVSPQDPPDRRRQIYRADCDALKESALVIAILPYDDPGTLIEIGLAKGWGIPVIVFDADRRASNLMLTETPNAMASSLEGVIDEVFALIGTQYNRG